MRNPFVITLLAFGSMLIFSMVIGSVFIPPAELWRAITDATSNETARTILLDIRLPRTLLIALVGAALGGSGAAPQPGHRRRGAPAGIGVRDRRAEDLRGHA